jgi:hypothetical protein
LAIALEHQTFGALDALDGTADVEERVEVFSFDGRAAPEVGIGLGSESLTVTTQAAEVERTGVVAAGVDGRGEHLSGAVVIAAVKRFDPFVVEAAEDVLIGRAEERARRERGARRAEKRRASQ